MNLKKKVRADWHQIEANGKVGVFVEASYYANGIFKLISSPFCLFINSFGDMVLLIFTNLLLVRPLIRRLDRPFHFFCQVLEVMLYMYALSFS